MYTEMARTSHQMDHMGRMNEFSSLGVLFEVSQ